MGSNCKRKHTRVPFESTVDLRFEDRTYERCLTKDLCLSGMWVMDGHLQEIGDECEIEFKEAGVTNNRLLRLRGQVVRVNEHGIALLFTDMNLNTYTNLQTMILDQADDPFKIAEEFLEEFPLSQ